MPDPDENDLLRHIEAVRSNLDAAAVDAAVRALEPLVRETARRVCCRGAAPKQRTSDFVDNALASIVARRERKGESVEARIALFDPSLGSFAGWLWTTLNRLLVDERRKSARRQKYERAFAAGELGEPKQGITDFGSPTAEAASPFSEADLGRIASWPVRDRLRLLGCSELWPKVPQKLWESWCGEADVPSPFPPTPNHFEHWDDWLAELAAAMNESRAAFKQHWYRKKARLADLDYVRELRDEA